MNQVNIRDEAAQVRSYANASRAASTRHAYEADWARFATWCGEPRPCLHADRPARSCHVPVREGRALIAFGMASALRRFELVAAWLQVADIRKVSCSVISSAAPTTCRTY